MKRERFEVFATPTTANRFGENTPTKPGGAGHRDLAVPSV